MAEGSNVVSSPTRFEGKRKAVVVCWFLGLGSLISWNSMLNIADYYYDLFPEYHPARVLTLVYQPFGVGAIAILAYYEARINTRIRITFGYILFFISTLGLLLIDVGSSGEGGFRNYFNVCVFVACFELAGAFVLGGMVGDLSFMHPVILQSFSAGLAASGALTSGLRLITKAALDKTDHGLRKGTLLFLAIAASFEFLCIFLYAFVFAKLPIVKNYRMKAASEGSKTVSNDLVAAGMHIHTEIENVDDAKFERLTNKQLLVKNIDYALDNYLAYALTLSILPGFLYENTGNHQLGDWYAVVLVAMYNVWDFIGRYVPLIDSIRLESRVGITIATLSRFLLIPCFYFTAKYGEQGWMIFLVSFLGLSNGYITVCVLMAAPRGYKAPEQNALGNLLEFFVLAGIFSGVVLDWLWLIGDGSF